MEDLRLSLIVLGALAIGGILVHGLWTIRKNAQHNKKARHELLTPEPELREPGLTGHTPQAEPELTASDPLSSDAPTLAQQVRQFGDFDDVGVGAVRVVAAPQQSMEKIHPQADTEGKNPISQAADNRVSPAVATRPQSPAVANDSDSGDWRAPVAPTTQGADLPPPPPSLLKSADKEKAPLSTNQPQKVEPVIGPEPVPSQRVEPRFSQEVAIGSAATEQGTPAQEPAKTAPMVTPAPTDKGETKPEGRPSLAQQARELVRGKKVEAAPKRKRREPRVAEDQMSIDFGMEPEPAAKAPKVEPVVTKPADTALQEVLVINLKAREGQEIPGSALLPLLLTLGFKFGEQDIFHRHVTASGSGPVLFSLANMFKPGVFDIDNMETFTTRGLSLFMIMPTPEEPHGVFNMMHNAARKLADEFSLIMLDGRRSTLTKQSLQQYVERIREFERKRMLQR